MNSLITRSRVKKLALDLAAQSKFRYGTGDLKEPRFTRVSKSFLDMVEASVRTTVAAAVERAPSRGRTLQ